MCAASPKLTINPVTIDSSGNANVDEGTSFEVMLNPSSFNHTRSICYDNSKTLGQFNSNKPFSKVGDEKVTFELIVDGTGATGIEADDVATQIQKLNGIVYKYDGDSHQPNHVRLIWSALIFFCRLDSMSVSYTLFKPDGTPLRAKISLSFVGFMSKEESALRANRSSPDLTHLIEFKAGDTLPNLCKKIYDDSSYYMKVAKVNGLTSFRNIKPGVKLNFPPLIDK